MTKRFAALIATTGVLATAGAFILPATARASGALPTITVALKGINGATASGREVSGAVTVTATSTGKLCGVESSFVDANFGTGWETATNTPTACELGITSKNGFAQELAFNSVLEGTLYASGLSAEAEWRAAHTPDSHEQISILPHLGRLAPDGSSALGDIPGHGKVTAIFWNSGIPKNSLFSIQMEVADGYSIVSTLTSQWPVPVGSRGMDTYPQAHQNAIKSLADRLLPLFYTKSKAKSAA